MPNIPPQDLEWLKAQGIDPYTVQIVPPQEMSKGSAVLARLKGGAGGTLGGGAGALAGMVGAEALPVSHIAPPYSEIAAGVIGGGVGALGGGYVGQKAQQAILPPEIEQSLEQQAQLAAQQHPYISAGTDIASSALASGGSFSPSTLMKAGRGAIRPLMGGGLSEADRLAMSQVGREALSPEGNAALPEILAQNRAMQNVGMQSVINPALMTGLNYATTGQLPTGRDLATQAIGGALFAKPSALGRWASRPSVEPESEPLAKEPESTTETSQTGQVGPWLDRDNISNTQVKAAFGKLPENVIPKMKPADMSPEDWYALKTKQEALKKMPVDDMRQQLHDRWVKQQADEAAQQEQLGKLNMAQDASTQAFLKAEQQRVEHETRVRDFGLAQEELSTQPSEHDANPSDVAAKPPSVHDTVSTPKTVVGPSPTELPLSKLQTLQTGRKQLGNDVNRPEQRPTTPIEGAEPTATSQHPLENAKLIFEQGQDKPMTKQYWHDNLEEGNDNRFDNRTEAEKIQDKMEETGARYSQPIIPEKPPLYADLIQQQKDLLAQGKAFDENGQLTPEYQAIWKKVEQEKNRQKGLPPKQAAESNAGQSTPMDIVDHIWSGKATTGSVMAKLAAHTDHPFSPMAKWLYENMDSKSRNVPWEDTMRDRSQYLPVKDKVQMAILQSHHIPIVMEEAIHSMTSAKLPKEWEGLRGTELRMAMVKYVANPSGNIHIKDLIGAYLQTAKHLGMYDKLFINEVKFHDLQTNTVDIKQGAAGHPDTAIAEGLPYAMGDLHEFIAHAFSDYNFQTTLDRIPSGIGNKSMWQRLVDAVTKLLGFPVNQKGMLDRVLRHSAELIRAPRESETQNAIQKPSTSGILSHPQEGIRREGSEREGMGRSNEGEEVAKKSQATPSGQPKNDEVRNLPLGVNKLFRAGLDTIRSLPHPYAGKVADTLQKVFQTRENILGQQWNPIIDTARKLGIRDNGRDAERVNDIGRWMREHDQEPPETMFQNNRQRVLFNTIRKSLEDNYKRRAANEEPVIRNGQPTMPQRNPYYWPTTTNPKAAQIIRDNTDPKEIARLKQVFTDYQTKLGSKPEETEQRWNDYTRALQGTSVGHDVGNAIFFNAARRAEGIPLPPEFTRPGLLKNLESYWHGQATDNAYYEHVEKNPQVMAALGYTRDAWNRPVEPLKEGAIIGNTAVRNVVNEIKGETMIGQQGQTIAKSESFATAAILGPLTELHKAISNPFKMLSTFADNPYQMGRAIYHAATNWGEGWTHARENGKIVMTSRAASDMIRSGVTAADRFAGLARGIRQIYTFNDLTDKLNLGLIQAMGENLVPLRIKGANEGVAKDMRTMKALDPDWTRGKEYTDQQISQLASNLAGIVHGTRDARTMPSWMLHDNEISAFFKLSSWGMAQTNSFMRDVYTPAMNGDIKPLVNSIFGAALGGYVLMQVRQELSGKKSQIPSLSEIAASDRGLKGNIPAIAYNMMAASSYAGFGGMFATMLRYPFDAAFKNTSQGATFPLDTIVENLANDIHSAGVAIANDPNLNWGELAAHFTGSVVQNNVQLLRVALNQAIDSGTITGTLAEKKQLSDALGKLRRFDMVEGLPYQEQDASGNQFMNLEQQKFKREQDIGKAVHMIPQLVGNIIDTYKSTPDVMMSKLKALKENQYATFPALETMPLQFMKYIGYLNRMEGPEAAQAELQEYMKHKITNEVKASAVP